MQPYYWKLRLEIEWLVVNVAEEGIHYLCGAVGVRGAPAAISQTPYRVMFESIRDRLRERFPFEAATGSSVEQAQLLFGKIVGFDGASGICRLTDPAGVYYSFA